MSFLAVTGHQGHHLDHLSNKGVVAMFSNLVIAMFRYLDSHHLRNPLDLFPVSLTHSCVLFEIKFFILNACY